MNGYWSEQDCLYNEATYGRNTVQNVQFYSQQRICREPWNMNRPIGLHSQMDRPNFFLEHLRQRDRQVPVSVYYNYKFHPCKDSRERGRGRGRGRRSQSVPRNCFGSDFEKYGQDRAWRNLDESSRQSFSFVSEDPCIRDDAIPPDDNSINKFRSIFRPLTDSMFGTQPTIYRITREQTKEEAEKHLNNIVKNIELPGFSNDEDTTESDVSVEKVHEVANYYGESITRIDESLSTLRIELPVVDWPKDAHSFNDLPVFDSETCIGGDGVTLEVFYLCKYCKMFAGGAEVKTHLRSRYHYERYRDFLRTGVPLSSSSDSSSSNEEEFCQQEPSVSATSAEVNNNTDVSTTSSPNIPNKKPLEDTDDDFLFNCHEELDFD